MCSKPKGSDPLDVVLEAMTSEDHTKRIVPHHRVAATDHQNDIAIRVRNLSKCYQIYGSPRDRLKQVVYPRVQRLIGKQPLNYYREFWALRNVSFDIKKGETVGIIGRNGSGKSTLLQLICGTLAPTGGHVHADGRIAALLELGSGFHPEFTGRENVYMNGAVLGVSKDDMRALMTLPHSPISASLLNSL